jgi:hypothetical protein
MQIQTLLVYALILIAIVALPYLARLSTSPLVGPRFDVDLGVGVLFLAVWLTILRGGYVAPLALLLVAPSVGRGGWSVLGGVAAAFLFTTAIWWMPYVQAGMLATIAFTLLALVAGFLPRLLDKIGAEATPAAGQPIARTFILSFAIGIAAGVLTVAFNDPDRTHTLWHHWGAYLAPVEAWLSGGKPFHDFPVQYGLGPTALLALTCGQSCWNGMFNVIVVADALYFATVAGCVVILTVPLGRGARWVAIAAAFAACFMWTGYPPAFAGPLITPSVAGLRFLPITAILLHILIAEQSGRRRDWIGHLLWGADLLWSPEAAFFGTLVWWPYLAIRNAEAADTISATAISIVKTALRGIIALAIGLVILLLILRQIAGDWPSAVSFLTYVQHPPGPLPVNPFGSIWIALSSILIACWAMILNRNTANMRPLYACLLGLMASGVYYLSRSHDNNILNLFPMLLLVLIAALARIKTAGQTDNGFAPSFITTILVAMIAFTAVFNYESWNRETAMGSATKFGSKAILHQVELKPDAPVQIVPAEGIAAINYAKSRSTRAVLLFHYALIMPASTPGSGWTSVNNAANFDPLPDSIVQPYVVQGAKTYHKDGWMVVEEPDQARWLRLFQPAYSIREARRFGRYTAYHMVPRQLP